MKQQRSGFSVMRRLIVLVRPLAPFMALAVLLGVAGFVCAIFLTILGGWAILEVLGLGAPLALGGLFACAAAFALLRGVLRYGEQACNHFIAFKLLALIRDKVFTALRRLCPAKLEGRDKGDLIAVITADIELLEVFYAHTISPATIALVMSVGMSVFIGAYHPLLGLLAAAGLYFAGAVRFDGVLIPLTALMSSFGPVVALANLGSTLQNTLAAGNRVLDILDEEPLVHEIAGRQTTAFSGAACEDVSFSYGEEPVLSRVSLRIPQGRVVGITGRSGSGKSTLLRLLMRFWDADGGAVRVSSRDVREVNTGDLRRMEGFVTQETHLFRDSIASNLRIGKRDATQAELEAACKKASVHEFILSLPKGYDTPVGELGDTLSGGERQRLGLARAFLHDAPFLLLDEPTSNLDSLNEGVILRSLQSERGGRTVVLVSHRASTMAVADEVYAAQEGRVS